MLHYLKKVILRYRNLEERFTNNSLDYDLWRAAKKLSDRFLPTSTLLLYNDEKDPIQTKRYGGKCWSLKRLNLEVRQPIHGKIHLFGAYDPQIDRI